MQLVTSTLKLPCVTDSQLCSWIYGTTFAAASRGLWACSCLFVMWWKQKVWPRRGAAHHAQVHKKRESSHMASYM